jgi:glycosyltransferase involved in cell wall biosynthesis
VPYVVSPRGALDPYLRRRHRFRKAVAHVLWQRRLLDNAATLHVTTREEAQLIADVAPHVNRAVIGNGIDWPLFQTLPHPSVFRASHLRNHQGPVILTIGRISHKKGLDVLIRAFARLASVVPAAILVIAGPDDEGLLPKLRAIAANEGVRRRVLFPGMLSRAEKLAALAAADVWALPSHTENFGIAVVEALAAGVPVLVSPAVNIANEAGGAGAALVAESTPEDFAAALLVLLGSDSERARVSAAGRRFSRRFDWSRIAPQLVSLYATVAGAVR